MLVILYLLPTVVEGHLWLYTRKIGDARGEVILSRGGRQPSRGGDLGDWDL
jgi:hypothetical protein